MRIIAGEFRSRVLVSPEGTATRPTMDRARESLFNVLSNLMGFQGISVLDLYAGSGALGFEALSRGASKATFVDQGAKAIDAIKKNSQALGVAESVTVLRQDVQRFLKSPPKEGFDLILMDPPYEESETAKLGEIIFHQNWLVVHGYCVIEHRFNTKLGPIASANALRELKSGEAHFTILTHATPS